MKTASIEYLGDLRTKAKHNRSGQEIITDAPIDNHGKGEAFSPTDLACTALGSCMLTVMGIAANTHSIDMKGATVEINKVMAENPRRISKIEVDIYMPAHIQYSSKEKAILTNAAKTCPVGRSLHPDLEEDFHMHWSN
jgi:putative redox protein